MQLAQAWAQVILPWVADASEHFSVLNAQWMLELRHNAPKIYLGKQIHTDGDWDSLVTQLRKKFGQAADNIVYGQHTKQEAEDRRQRLHEVFQGESVSISRPLEAQTA